MQRLAIMKCKELQFGDWVTDENGEATKALGW